MSRTYGACLDSSLPSRDRKNSFSNKLSRLVEHVPRLYTPLIEPVVVNFELERICCRISETYHELKRRLWQYEGES